MKDNKTIGFDILDNAGLDKIDQIGTDTDMLDEKTKMRILEMTRKRFNDAIKGENMMTFNNDINENAEIVENVEVYKRSKISKIMTSVINTAAVAGLAVGSVFLVKNINRDNKPVEPDLPATSTTESAELTAEEKARNKRIEEYIDYLCYYCDGESDKDKFYDTIKIDYAYLDINNDSVDELLIRYHNLNDFSPYYEGTEINYFNGTKYIPVGETNTTFKFDLQNRKLYQLSEGHEGGYWLCVRTWDEFSDDTEFFTLTDNYTSDIISFEPLEYTYSHNDTECSMEEYEKAMAEYENCVGAEVNYMPYI